MTVAVVDVGSNTVRLLVAGGDGGGIEKVAEAKRVVGLGADIERSGSVSAAKLTETAETLREFADTARKAGARLFEVIVASPGRQARNADQLVHTLSRAAGTGARVLTREEEGELAFEGAMALAPAKGAVAVCDVGGGSTQIAVGTAKGGVSWVRSVDLGALRLSARVPDCHTPTLRREAEAAFSGITPPLPRTAIAVGGTARAVKKLVGRRLGPAELERAAALLAREPFESIVEPYGIPVWRAKVLPGGVELLSQVQQLLGVSLDVGRGGVREGFARRLLARLAIAQAR